MFYGRYVRGARQMSTRHVVDVITYYFNYIEDLFSGFILNSKECLRKLEPA